MNVDRGKWSQVPLKSLLKEYSIRNKSSELTNVYSVTNSKGFVPASEYFDNTVQSSNLSTYKIVEEGMFAYNPSRINVGSIAIQDAEKRVIVSPLYVIFSITSGLNPHFLLKYLKSNIGLSQIRSKTSGSVRASLRFKDLGGITIPLPPLVEQESIVLELNTLQKVIDGYKAQIADLDLLAQSIFLDNFGDPINNPKGWNTKSLGDLCNVTSSKRIYQNELTENGVPFYRISDFPDLLKNGRSHTDIYISKERYLTLRDNDLTPQSGDLLITSRGTIGLCYIVTNDDCFYFQDGMITWLRNIDCSLMSSFLAFMFNASLLKKQIEKEKNGSTVSYLSISMFKRLNIIVPPLCLQQQFDMHIERIGQQKELLRQQLADAEMLMAERMQYYFS